MIKAYIDDATTSKINMSGTDEDIVPETVILCSEIIKKALNTVPPYIKDADDYILDRIRRLVAEQGRIKALPPVRPEIIHCKDCVNWDTTWKDDCDESSHYCPLIDGVREGDWYCAYGERKDD